MKTTALTERYSFLEELGIKDVNPGACAGPDDWSQIDGHELLEVVTPIDGSVIGKVAMASAADYEHVVSAAQKSFLTWRMTPAPVRGQMVREVGDELRRLKDPLGALVTFEMGKILAEGKGEVQEAIDISDFAVGLSRQLYGLTMQSERPQHRMYEQWHPLGVIGIITAFNFPIAVWSWNSMVASVCGDTMVWKPSSKTPLCAIAVQNVMNRAMKAHGLTGIFTLVIGRGGTIGERLINDKRIPLISSTGSTSMGQRVAEAAAKRLGRTILELGGNNAIIVAEDANMDMAVRAILFGAVGTAGQRCTTTRRIIAHKSIIEDLTEKLVKAYGQIRIGNPLEADTLMGPLVDMDAVDTMLKAVENIRKQGGRVVTGGKKLDKPGFYASPAIVRVPGNTPLVCEETFAPILYIMPYETMDEALALHNGVPQGLTSAIFTDSVKKAEKFLSGLGSDCGIANVNIGTSGAEIGGAFGGEKETGGGRESGSDAWKQYMRRQTTTINWSDQLPLAQGIKFGN
ncbi:MAG TPA: aldehyde dehydrogenase family protein [Candidatus Acidoferrales bacterium]|nr:aldehyde dehydrogenase family protein [Candidatus Acidoferrales bacterium]